MHNLFIFWYFVANIEFIFDDVCYMIKVAEEMQVFECEENLGQVAETTLGKLRKTKEEL